MADDYSRIHSLHSEHPTTVMHPQTDFNVADVSSRLTREDVEILTGDVRRAYNFGNSYTELTKSRDPLLHIMNKCRKIPTDDPKWKYTHKRKQMAYERYGYITGISAATKVVAADTVITLTSQTVWNDAGYRKVLGSTINSETDMYANASLPTTQDTAFSLMIMGDYKISGNMHNLIGKDSDDAGFIKLGAPGTSPNFFLPNNVLQIPTGVAPTSGNTKPTGYARVIIDSVFSLSILSSGTGNPVLAEGKLLNVRLVKAPDAAAASPTSLKGGSWSKTTAILFDVSHSTGVNSLAQKLVPARTEVSGSAYHELSGFGETYRTQPYSTDFGLNQIFKGAASMSGRAMTTVKKYEPDGWKEEWGKVSMDVIYDMAQTAYFGEQFEDANGVTYTEGVVNFALANGHQFELDYATKDIDDFFDDVSALNDKRLNTDLGKTHGMFVPTATWNWLRKIGKTAGGTFNANNLNMHSSFRAQYLGFTKTELGLPTQQILVDGTILNFMLDPHLDGTYVKAMCLNMQGCSIRPLIGNGKNRDFRILPGVKTEATSGDDYRVDLITADVGFEWGLQEGFAIWT